MSDHKPQCWFCGKAAGEVDCLISAPEEVSPARICNDCIEVCLSILNEEYRVKRGLSKITLKK